MQYQKSKRRFLLLILSAFSIGIIGVGIYFIGQFVIPFLSYSQEQCRYIEQTSQFRLELEEYLNKSYRKNGRYPDQIDFTLFDFYSSKYSSLLSELAYSANEDSFIVTWKIPTSTNSHDDYFVWRCGGSKGSRNLCETGEMTP